MKVSNLPAGTKGVILSFNDETYTPNSNGGHGVMLFHVAEGSAEADLPSVSGESWSLPDGVEKVAAYKSKKVKGVYLPPCSGGKGNRYTVDVRAVDADRNILDEIKVEMGKY